MLAFKLAKTLGIVDPDRMLATMSERLFQEWLVYERVERGDLKIPTDQKAAEAGLVAWARACGAKEVKRNA